MPTTDLITRHEQTCGPERTDLLIDALGAIPAALEWALRKDLENRGA